MPSRNDIIKAARGYLGVPFRHQGRSREGLDCAGLVVVVAHDLGLSDFDTSDYDRRPDGVTMGKTCREQLIQRTDGKMEPGDVVLFRDGGRHPTHLALVGEHKGRKTMIHATVNARKVVEHGFDGAWHHKLAAVFTIPGIE